MGLHGLGRIGCCCECICIPKVLATQVVRNDMIAMDLRPYKGPNMACPGSIWRLQESNAVIYGQGTVDAEGRLAGLMDQYKSGYSYYGYMRLEIGCKDERGIITWPKHNFYGSSGIPSPSYIPCTITWYENTNWSDDGSIGEWEDREHRCEGRFRLQSSQKVKVSVDDKDVDIEVYKYQWETLPGGICAMGGWIGALNLSSDNRLAHHLYMDRALMDGSGRLVSVELDFYGLSFSESIQFAIQLLTTGRNENGDVVIVEYPGPSTITFNPGL